MLCKQSMRVFDLCVDLGRGLSLFGRCSMQSNSAIHRGMLSGMREFSNVIASIDNIALLAVV